MRALVAIVRAAVAIVLASVALTGCGFGASAARSSSPVERADVTHEYRSGPPPPQRAATSEASAIRAIRAFVTAYINWTAPTVAADMRLLAAASIGQARAAMELAAAGTARDYELQRGGIANSGTVQAIAPLAGGRDQYVVVTRELTTAADSTAYQGLRPAWHLTLATVTEVGPAEWVLSGWQPES